MNYWVHTASYQRHEGRVHVYAWMLALSLLLINGGAFTAHWLDVAFFAIPVGAMLFALFIACCAFELMYVLVSVRLCGTPIQKHS